uniref:Ig-like domain-containing protein n=1 Tax=Chelonoidis abingdonii TaxID=106734 RepID=A0A8C0FYL6_CHEAB
LMACLLPTAEHSYPKPSISLRSSEGVSLGGSVGVWCKGQHQGMRFVLNKEGRHFPPLDSDGLEVVFSISNVRREDGGNYNCSYHRRSEPFNMSYPSDPLELVVRGEGPASASSFPTPGPARPSHANRTIRSWLRPDPAEGTPGWGRGSESLGSSSARGEQQPLETPGREAPLTLPLVCRNRKSLFNPVIPSRAAQRGGASGAAAAGQPETLS